MNKHDKNPKRPTPLRDVDLETLADQVVGGRSTRPAPDEPLVIMRYGIAPPDPPTSK